jgi:signal transduction histidine kinase
VPPREDSARLLSLAVHEFRTPMTVVAGYLRMLLKDRAGPVTDAQRKLLEEAERSCKRLSALLAELSDIANLDGGRMTLAQQRMDLLAIVERAAAEAERPPDRDVQIEMRGEPGVLPVSGDAQRLTSAVAAICTAVMRDAVQAAVLVVDRGIQNAKTGASARLIVGDPETVDELAATAPRRLGSFEDSRGGVGLSLAVARRIIEGHGGRIFSPAGERRRTGVLVLLPLEH